MLLLTTGCATSYVRSLERTTVFDGPRVVIVRTNGDVVIKTVRFASTEPNYNEQTITQRYYRITRENMLSETQQSDTGQSVELHYDKYEIAPLDADAAVLDAAELAGISITNSEPDVAYVYRLSKGFGGVNPLAYPGAVRISIGPQFSQNVDEYRTTWGKWSQPLIILAVPIDIITSPIQAVYFLWRLDKAWVG